MSKMFIANDLEESGGLGEVCLFVELNLLPALFYKSLESDWAIELAAFIGM